ncbi:MAG: MFS transporter [Candidatus Dormibacteria bacterium]
MTQESPTLVDRAGFGLLLGRSDYRRVWIGQVAGQLADKFLMFSLLILAYRVSGANTEVAFTLLSYTLPALLIGPAAGVLVDRYDRKRIMVWTNFGRAGLVALIPILAMTPLRDAAWTIIAVTVAFSAVGQLFAPAEAAAIPSLVSRASLVSANSLFMMTMVVTLVVGAPLAQVVSKVDIYLPYWVAVALFCAGGISLLGVRTPLKAQRSGTERTSLAQELLGGLDAIRHSRGLRFAFGQLTTAILVMFMVFVLGPGYMQTVLHLGPENTYLVLVPAMAGMIGSAVVLGQVGLGRPREWLLTVGLTVLGLMLVGLAGAPTLLQRLHQPGLLIWVMIPIALVAGIQFGLLLIPALTLLMEQAGEDQRGRIFGLLNMVINGATAAPVVVAGSLADLYGVNHVLGGMGAILVVGGIFSGVAAWRGRLQTWQA